MLDILLIQLLSGISRGMILFSVAAGLTLIFGVLRVANFAHGSFYMLAMYMGYTVSVMLVSPTYSFLAALIIVPAAMALFGAVVDVLLLRRIAVREHQYQFILTFALTLIIADGVKLFWGKGYYSIPRPAFLAGSVQVLDRPFPSYYVMVIFVGAAIAFLIWLLMTHTMFGKIIRAAISDREMVSSLGHNVPLLNTSVFALGSAITGLGGAIAAPIGSIGLGIDTAIIIEAFAAVIIGTPGNVYGALLGSLIIGVIHSIGIVFAPRMTIVFIFIVICFVLVFLPQGIMGWWKNRHGFK